MRRWAAAIALVAGLAPAAAGCAANSTGELTASAATKLRQAVEAVRQAAATGSYSQLQQAVASLKSLVQQEEQSGGVTSTRATDILNAADILLQDAKPTPSPTPTFVPPPTTTTLLSPTPTPSATPSASSSPTPSLSASPTGSLPPLVQTSAQPQ